MRVSRVDYVCVLAIVGILLGSGCAASKTETSSKTEARQEMDGVRGVFGSKARQSNQRVGDVTNQSADAAAEAKQDFIDITVSEWKWLGGGAGPSAGPLTVRIPQSVRGRANAVQEDSNTQIMRDVTLIGGSSAEQIIVREGNATIQRTSVSVITMKDSALTQETISVPTAELRTTADEVPASAIKERSVLVPVYKATGTGFEKAWILAEMLERLRADVSPTPPVVRIGHVRPPAAVETPPAVIPGSTQSQTMSDNKGFFSIFIQQIVSHQIAPEMPDDVRQRLIASDAFLSRILLSNDPHHGVPVSQRVGRGLDQLQLEALVFDLAGYPSAQAPLLLGIAKSYADAGDLEKANGYLDRAVASGGISKSDVEGQACLLEIAGYIRHQEGRFADSCDLYSALLKLRLEQSPQCVTHVATARYLLADCLQHVGQIDRSTQLATLSLEARRVAGGGRGTAVSACAVLLLKNSRAMGRYQEALEYGTLAMEAVAELGDGDLHRASALFWTGVASADLGRWYDAVDLLTRARKAAIASYGGETIQSADTLWWLARAQIEVGRANEALTTIADGRAIGRIDTARADLARDANWCTLAARAHLAQGDREQAAKEALDAVQGFQRAASDPGSYVNALDVLWATRKSGEDPRMELEQYRIGGQVIAAQEPQGGGLATAHVLHHHADALAEVATAAYLEEAETLARNALAIYDRLNYSTGPERKHAVVVLERVLQERQAFVAREELFQQEIERALKREDFMGGAYLCMRDALFHLELAQHASAVESAQRALELLEAARRADWIVGNAQTILGRALEGSGASESGRGLIEAGLSHMTSKGGAPTMNVDRARGWLASPLK